MPVPLGMRWGRSYKTAHNEVKRRFGPASDKICVDCMDPAQEWAFIYPEGVAPLFSDHAKPRPYSLNPEHYQPMCRACHRLHDMRKDPADRQTRVETARSMGWANAGRTPWNKKVPSADS